MSRNKYLLIISLLVILILVAFVITFFSKNNKLEVASVNSISDEQFVSAVGDPTARVIAHGDINQDGFEDAIVETMSCGASCSFSLEVVFNIDNKSTGVLNPTEYANFEPAFVGSSAAKSQITDITIKDGIISLSGYGLACTNPNTEEICTEAKWHTLKTVTYKFDGKNIVQINPTPAPYVAPRVIDREHLSNDEIYNQSYPKSPGIATNSNLYFTTYKDGIYQSPKIVCNGANTCPEGEYSFSEIYKVAINLKNNVAAVVALSSYAPSLNEFHQKNEKYGAQSTDLYLITKNSGLVKISKPFNLSGSFVFDQNLNSLKVVNVSIDSENAVSLEVTGRQNDGNGNFTNVNKIYHFKLMNDILVLQ